MKKIDFFSDEKMAIHGVKWHFSALSFSALKASITAIQPSMAQLPTFSAMATALHYIALKKTALHGVKWHFSALLHQRARFFTGDIIKMGSRFLIIFHFNNSNNLTHSGTGTKCCALRSFSDWFGSIIKSCRTGFEASKL